MEVRSNDIMVVLKYVVRKMFVSPRRLQYYYNYKRPIIIIIIIDKCISMQWTYYHLLLQSKIIKKKLFTIFAFFTRVFYSNILHVISVYRVFPFKNNAIYYDLSLTEYHYHHNNNNNCNI